MENNKAQKPVVDQKAEVLSKMANGHVRLEFYKEKGHVVSVIGSKNIIWFTWEEFQKIYDEFSQIVELRTKA